MFHLVNRILWTEGHLIDLASCCDIPSPYPVGLPRSIDLDGPFFALKQDGRKYIEMSRFDLRPA